MIARHQSDITDATNQLTRATSEIQHLSYSLEIERNNTETARRQLMNFQGFAAHRSADLIASNNKKELELVVLRAEVDHHNRTEGTLHTEVNTLNTQVGTLRSKIERLEGVRIMHRTDAFF
jgi:chromosome segregation ATPase